MAVLKNPKHELFAQGLAKGKSQAEAYALAGYKPSEPNASRLTRNDKISARIAELLQRSATKAEITIDSLRDMLIEDRVMARDLGQPSAAISAVEKLAKLYGHMIDRKEVGKPGEFDSLNADERKRLLGAIEAELAAGESQAAGAKPPGQAGPISSLH